MNQGGEEESEGKGLAEDDFVGQLLAMSAELSRKEQEPFETYDSKWNGVVSNHTLTHSLNNFTCLGPFECIF